MESPEPDYCELTGDFDCPQPLSRPASRCELCLGCLDPVLHPPPKGVMYEWLDVNETNCGSTF